MKKVLIVFLVALCMGTLIATPVEALFGGGFSGPLPVYNIDKTVDIATIQTQINTLQQLEAALKNLSSMDAAAAIANMGYIQQTLAELVALQQQMQSVINDYKNFQQAWDSTYKDFQDYSGMSGEDYINQMNQLIQVTNNAIYDAMRAQGLVAQIGDDAGNLQTLLNASQSAEGALAAAQAGNQIAAMQAQQMMRLQQMIAQNNQAQLAYFEEKKQQELASEAAAARAFSGEVNLQEGQGPGFDF